MTFQKGKQLKNNTLCLSLGISVRKGGSYKQAGDNYWKVGELSTENTRNPVGKVTRFKLSMLLKVISIFGFSPQFSPLIIENKRSYIKYLFLICLMYVREVKA